LFVKICVNEVLTCFGGHNVLLCRVYRIVWFGRVVSSVSWQDNIEASHFEPKDQKGWGYRYRVRYFGLHSGSTEDLPDEQLPMANVILPVTAGSGLGGSFDTPAILAGTVVTGIFQDGVLAQNPYIDGILINSNNDVPKKQPLDKNGGHQLFNDTYKGTTPQFAAYVPDYLITIKKIERPSNANPQYQVAQSVPYTLTELRQRTAAREAAGFGIGNVGDVVTDPEIIREIQKEQYIIKNGTLPPE
jgi:hypothetical protein